jgi:PQQ-dependent dehydrogenase (methanol/ethanol family)
MHKLLVLAGAVSAALAAPLSHAAAPGDWPTYNRTLTSDRFSPLKQITPANAAGMKVVCSYDSGESTAFQSGLLQVDGALFATTEHNTYSINPDTCQLNWKAHEDFKDGYLGSQRGVAIEAGRVFRGAGDGNVYAYDQKSGKKLWQTQIADTPKGETVPASPIVWNGMVFIGNAGGDNRGVKGRMYALDAATGKIVWEFYLVPKTAKDPERGPQGKGIAPAASWNNAAGVEVTGGATWTSYSLDPATGELYVPGGNPAPDFAKHLRKGANLYAGSVIVLDAKTGDYKRHFSLVPDDFHDYDVSSAPALFTSKNGTDIMAVTPKDGFIYAFDRKTSKRLYKLPMTTQFNTTAKLSPKGTRFCPGTQGGSEWNGPAYDMQHDAVITGQVDWCSTVNVDDDDTIKSVAAAQAWSGAGGGFGKNDPPAKWAGWLTSVDAVTGKQRWKFKAPNPIIGGVTPTAGNVVFLGDMGGNFYVIDSASGKQLFKQDLKGAVAGGVITYDTGAGQKVAVSSGMQSKIWPTPKATAQIQVMAAEQAVVYQTDLPVQTNQGKP